MATTPPTRADRDANLEALKTAVNDWANDEIVRLDSEAKFLKAVLQGRNSSSVGTKNLRQATLKTVSEINNFLGTVIKTGTNTEHL